MGKSPDLLALNSGTVGMGMPYAGFWPRTLALLIDALLFLPLLVVQTLILSRASLEMAAAAQMVLGATGYAYTIGLHARWGQTVGKMVAGVRVVRLNGSSIGLDRALLRNSVDAAWWVVHAGGLVYLVFTWTGPEWALLTTGGRSSALAERHPLGYWLNDVVMQVWMWSEVVVLLTNRKRRALHDFIAGTVVVHTRSATSRGVSRWVVIGIAVVCFASYLGYGVWFFWPPPKP